MARETILGGTHIASFSLLVIYLFIGIIKNAGITPNLCFFVCFFVLFFNGYLAQTEAKERFLSDS